MTQETERDDALREMAQHRGFKLLKSRRRKPGVGDFGRFGLTDAAGKTVMGVGPDGLTALPDEIVAYLRTGALDSWTASTKATAHNPKSAKSKPARDGPSEADALQLDNTRAELTAHAVGRSTKRKSPAPTSRYAESDARSPPKHGSEAGSKQLARPTQAEPQPPAVLVLRKAKKEDASALAILLSELSGIDRTAPDVARDLVAARKQGGGMLVADLGGLIGCIAWAIVPTVHRGPIGRITVVIVTAKERRKGVGRRLVDGALAVLGEAGCPIVEAMSDIDIRNAHNFFRSLDFAQASYRFTRSTEQTGT